MITSFLACSSFVFLFVLSSRNTCTFIKLSLLSLNGQQSIDSNIFLRRRGKKEEEEAQTVSNAMYLFMSLDLAGRLSKTIFFTCSILIHRCSFPLHSPSNFRSIRTIHMNNTFSPISYPCSSAFAMPIVSINTRRTISHYYISFVFRCFLLVSFCSFVVDLDYGTLEYVLLRCFSLEKKNESVSSSQRRT
jgi:hypothetical protein